MLRSMIVVGGYGRSRMCLSIGDCEIVIDG